MRLDVSVWRRNEGSGPSDATCLLFFFFPFTSSFLPSPPVAPHISSSLRGWQQALSKTEDSRVGIPSPELSPAWQLSICLLSPHFRSPQHSLTPESQSPALSSFQSDTGRTANNLHESRSLLEEVGCDCHRKVRAQVGMDKCLTESLPCTVLPVPLYLLPLPSRTIVGPPTDLTGFLLLPNAGSMRKNQPLSVSSRIRLSPGQASLLRPLLRFSPMDAFAPSSAPPNLSLSSSWRRLSKVQIWSHHLTSPILSTAPRCMQEKI